jgi:two-component system, cell cycle sensor histidine kinase and response regulator CckA
MSGLDRIRILTIESERPEGADVASAVRQLGYEVVATCQSGEEALALFEEARPDLVLTDIPLSGEMDGVATAHELNRRGHVAIIYVTSCADLATVARARETQPHGYLLKPFTQDELRLSIEVAATRYLDEVERQRREQSYFEAFQSLSDGVIAADLAGMIVFINPAAEKITGWEGGAAVGRSLNEVFRIFTPDGEAAEVNLVDGGDQAQERTVWLTDRTGQRVSIQDRTAAIRDQRNSLTGLIILFRKLVLPPLSVSGREGLPAGAGELAAGSETVQVPPAQQMEQVTAPAVDAELAQRPEPPPVRVSHPSAPLVDVVESISDPLIAVDGSWRMVFANAAAARLFGRSTPQLLGLGFWELLPAAARESHHETLAHAMLHRQATNCEMFYEEKQSWLELRSYPFAEGLLLLVKDITERRGEEERKSRMDRLESLGLLARGFAHDFNNLLTVLLGNLSLAELRLRGVNPLPELQTAKQATLQAQNLVQQLLTFARGGAPIKRPTELAELIEAFFQHHAKIAGFEYEREVQSGLPQVAIDPAQIRRVLGNLVRNAEQSQPKGGRVIVRCYAPDLAELYPGETFDDDLPQQVARVVIEVRDEGEGIPPENLAHVFEPYYSTRKAENATGLGLTVCESIAKAHNGSISVRSEVGTGTTVRFYLPVDADSEEVDALGLAKESQPVEVAAPRILVLEDDPLVRSLIVRNLSTQGFEVVESAEGSETVRLYQESLSENRPYDVVILDLSIPNGMGGVRTMEKLRGMDPNVVAIVSSGYSDDPVMAKPAAYGFTAVLPKPYEPADMLRLVRNVLSARGLRSAK